MTSLSDDGPFYTIYKIENLVNRKIYIGKHMTKILDDGYMGSGKLISKAIQKYGLEKFKKEIIFIFKTKKEMDDKEAELVTKDFCLREDTYNLCEGGKGGWSSVNMTIDLAARNRKINKNRDYSDKSFKEKLSLNNSRTGWPIHNTNGMLGKKHTNETKNKMSEKATGSFGSQYGTMWITDGMNNSKIKKDDQIPNGWYRGRILQSSNGKALAR